MPEISRFFGIIITMFYGDHDPPHFHVFYEGEKSKINILTGEVMEGNISRRALRLVQDWIELHNDELIDTFEKIKKQETNWKKIEPLK